MQRISKVVSSCLQAFIDRRCASAVRDIYVSPGWTDGRGKKELALHTAMKTPLALHTCARRPVISLAAYKSPHHFEITFTLMAKSCPLSNWPGFDLLLSLKNHIGSAVKSYSGLRCTEKSLCYRLLGPGDEVPSCLNFTNQGDSATI